MRTPLDLAIFEGRMDIVVRMSGNESDNVIEEIKQVKNYAFFSLFTIYYIYVDRIYSVYSMLCLQYNIWI
jgi:hypothetical protein